MSFDFDCIVLGAGIAGVTAARNLQRPPPGRPGLRVLILEGNAVVGGRMRTRTDLVHNTQFAGLNLPLEVGAEYVHISEHDRYKEFFDEIRAQGFRTKKKFAKWGDPPVLGRGHNRLTFEGWDNPESLIAAMIRDPHLCALEELFDEVRDVTRDVPAGTFVRAQGYTGERAEALGLYAISSHAPGVLDPAAGEDTLSVLGLRQDHITRQLDDPFERKLTENDRVVAFSELPMRIEQQFRGALGGSTLFEHEVVRVERIDGGVRVSARRPGGVAAAFTARCAVCTFSVGMLAARGEAIFGDLFPEEKRQALQVVKMGPITKLSVEFRNRFWDREMTVLSNPMGEARTFFASFPDRSGPHVLTALLMGRDHKLVSALDDEQALVWLFDQVERIFNPEYPAVRWRMEDKVLRYDDGGVTRWSFHRQEWSDRPGPGGRSDEFALGGNSFIAYTGDPPIQEPRAAREALKSPLRSLPLFWAGEATAPVYDRNYQPLAVHGAYISGVRVASDVAHYLQHGEQAFRIEYQARYVDDFEPAPQERTLRFDIVEDEHRILRAYAHRRTGGDLKKGAKNLVRRYLKAHGTVGEGEPDLGPEAPPGAALQEVELRFRGRALERLREYAIRKTGEDLDAAARRLLRLEIRRISPEFP